MNNGIDCIYKVSDSQVLVGVEGMGVHLVSISLNGDCEMT